MAGENVLYYGDNLYVLRDHIPDESIDLIYLDPPFNSNRSYNVIFREANTSGEAEAQIEAFDDTWRWTTETERALNELAQSRNIPPPLVDLLNGFVGFLGRNDLTAYLVMLAGRLIELHRVLKPHGTLFLHCDLTAGHYIKIVLDAVFGKDKLINQITWKRTSAHSDARQGGKRMGRITDLIFWYAKGETWTHNVQYTPYSQAYIEDFYRHVEEGTGRRYRLDNLTGPGGERKGNPAYEVMGVTRYWRYSKAKMQALIDAGRIVQTNPGAVPQYKRYLDEMPGVPLQDIWTDIKPVQSHSKEYLGYPTQKPRPLLERIIRMASNPGDLVLDPFCGCGTTVAAAQALDRRWIGIDITHLAINLICNRLNTMFPGISYRVVGQPTTLDGARKLAATDRHEFELWAIAQVGARPAKGQPKKGADQGVDGVLFFPDPKTRKQQKVIVQVKSGKVKRGDVATLAHDLEREGAVAGLFLTLDPPTAPMIAEAASVGFYKTALLGSEYSYPRIQILTIEGLLSGRERPQLPFGATAALKQAEKYRARAEDFMQDMFAGIEDVEDQDGGDFIDEE